MTKKKLLALGLSAVMVLSLAACGNNSSENLAPKNTPNPAVTDEQNTQPTQQPQKAPPVDTGKVTPDPVGTDPVEAVEPLAVTDAVTAESLINGGKLDDVDSMDVNVIMDYVVQMDASDMLGESGGNMQMEMGIQLDLAIQAEKDAVMDEARSHLYGTIALQMFGMDYSDVMESYRITHEDGSSVVYDWSSETSTWSKNSGFGTISDDELNGFYGLSALDASVIDNLELLEPHEGEAIYTVLGSISLANICAATGMEPEDMFVGMLDETEDVPVDMVYDLIFTYDAETRQLKSIYFALDPDSVSFPEGMSIDSFTMSYVINGVNNVKVTIPQDVLDGATKTSTPDDYFSSELDGFPSEGQN